MAPILDALADGREHLDEEIQEHVAQHFQLTASERALRLKNGIPVYKNRTAWGLVYLEAGAFCPDEVPCIKKIAEQGGHEVYKITTAGATAQRDRTL